MYGMSSGEHRGDKSPVHDRVAQLERENAQYKAASAEQNDLIEQLRSQVSQFGYETFQAVCKENEEQSALIEKLARCLKNQRNVSEMTCNGVLETLDEYQLWKGKQ